MRPLLFVLIVSHLSVIHRFLRFICHRATCLSYVTFPPVMGYIIALFVS